MHPDTVRAVTDAQIARRANQPLKGPQRNLCRENGFSLA
jgi:hypothetical protein